MLNAGLGGAHPHAATGSGANDSTHWLGKIQAASSKGDLESAQKYALMLTFDGFADAAVSVDANRRIWLFNKRSEDVFGYERAEIVGRPLETVLIDPHSRRLGTTNAEIASSADDEGLQVGRRELLGLRKDGSEFLVQATLSAYGWGGAAVVAITLQEAGHSVRAEEALSRSGAQLRHFLDGLSAALVLKDLDGKIRFVNRRFEEWHGLLATSVIGKTSSEIHPVIFADVCAGQDGQVLETRQPYRRELPVPFADGALHSVVVTKFPVSDGDGELLGLGVMGVEISEQERLETACYQAMNLAALGQLAGGVAHEFNNISATVLLNAELLQQRLGRDNKQLQKMIRATSRGSKLIRRLRAFSRQERLRPSILNPAKLVAGMHGALMQALGPAIDMEVERGPGPWPVFADPVRLQEAVLELAANAHDAMPHGGRFVVEMANSTLQAEDTTARCSVTPGDYVVLSLRDSGCGIAPNVLERVFEPFFTTKDIGQGSGLGLSMVYGFAKESGGRVTIESEPGCGTTVSLVLPRAKQTADRPEPDAMTPGAGARPPVPDPCARMARGTAGVDRPVT